MKTSSQVVPSLSDYASKRLKVSQSNRQKLQSLMQTQHPLPAHVIKTMKQSRNPLLSKLMSEIGIKLFRDIALKEKKCFDPFPMNTDVRHLREHLQKIKPYIRYTNDGSIFIVFMSDRNVCLCINYFQNPEEKLIADYASTDYKLMDKFYDIFYKDTFQKDKCIDITNPKKRTFLQEFFEKSRLRYMTRIRL